MTNYENLFRDGRCVSIHVSKWSMKAHLDKSEIGIGEDTVLPDIVRLGHKILIQPEVSNKFVTLEQTARKYLKDNSFPFEFANAYFVPNNRVLAVHGALTGYKEKFYEAVNDFVINYSKLKEEMITKYPGLDMSRYYPQEHKVRDLFKFNISVFEIKIPKEMKETSLAEIASEQEAKEKLAEMHRQQRESINREFGAFLHQSTQLLRNAVISSFQKIADKILNKEVITGHNLNTIVSVVNDFKNLNFIGDNQLESKLDELKALATSDADYKTDTAALQVLSQSINSTLEAASSLSDVDSVTGEYLRKLDV